ncbi:WD40/YVTN/BNR-like repeat-containing protein [Phytohabitans flavus]|uniref:WD40/YVTN/BNR-like repeat-containing protein n=1 Tax=Phytohabitans flavus TaxID=1076124 RepID=UPI00362EFB2C
MIDQRYRDLAGAAEEAARPPEFAAVRRRATRFQTRRRAGGALAVAVVAASGAAGVAALRPSAATLDAAAPDRRMVAVGAADAEHLYAAVADCPACPTELLASGDGGRTWEERPRSEPDRGTFALRVLAPRIVVESTAVWMSGTPSPVPVAPGNDNGMRVTIDGGRTWSGTTISETAVAAVPPGTRAVDCHIIAAEVRTDECPVYAVDPESGGSARSPSSPSWT